MARQIPHLVADERTTGSCPVARVEDRRYMLLPLGYPPSLFYRCWRKAIDGIFASIGLLVLLLLLPFLAALIRLDSPGPVFYHQERPGLQGRRFRIVKFRSMHTDAALFRAEHALLSLSPLYQAGADRLGTDKTFIWWLADGPLMAC